tara:strand:- start:1403 stop:1573 length:171 start_codon:yes stop_codon:yes gene_type:complete
MGLDKEYVRIKVKNFKAEMDAIMLWAEENDQDRFFEYIDDNIAALKKFKKQMEKNL